MDNEQDDSPRSSRLPPGYDENNPYQDKNLDQYPDWWQKNIKEFRHNNLRPYRPPRFTDDELVPETISRLEAKLNIQIRLRATDPQIGDDWEIWIDNEQVSSIGRYRGKKGNSVYELCSDEFVQLVTEAVDRT